MPRRKPLAEPIIPAAGRWHILDLTRHQCHFICTPHYGPRDAHRYCGEAISSDASTPYCEAHRAIVYRAGATQFDEPEAEGVAA